MRIEKVYIEYLNSLIVDEEKEDIQEIIKSG